MIIDDIIKEIVVTPLLFVNHDLHSKNYLLYTFDSYMREGVLDVIAPGYWFEAYKELFNVPNMRYSYSTEKTDRLTSMRIPQHETQTTILVNTPERMTIETKRSSFRGVYATETFIKRLLL